MVEDAELLRQYAEQRADAAFAEFVHRHVDLVYGSALRRVGGDLHLAEDVTQQVFAAAAGDAARLARHPTPVGWLFATTRNRAVQVVRSERRRRVREQAAFAMSSLPPDPPLDWEKLRPFIDEVLDELDDRDRQIVLLRFFENRSYGEIAAQIRAPENAARMRVDRALDRINALLQRRGVTSSSAALATVLLADAMTAAPTGLAAAAASAAMTASGATAAGSVLSFMGMTKVHVIVASLALAAGATGLIVEQRAVAQDRAELVALRTQLEPAAAAVDENGQLKRQVAEAERSRRAALAMIADVQQKTGVAEKQLAALRAAREKARQSAPPRPTYAGAVYDVSALDAPPQPTFRTPPEYPSELRKQGVTGKAVVEFVVGADGRVADVQVLSATHPEFAEAAAAGVAQWQFDPGKVRGVAVGSRLQIPITFALGDPMTPGAAPKPTSPTGKVHLEFSNWF